MKPRECRSLHTIDVLLREESTSPDLRCEPTGMLLAPFPQLLIWTSEHKFFRPRPWSIVGTNGFNAEFHVQVIYGLMACLSTTCSCSKIFDILCIPVNKIVICSPILSRGQHFHCSRSSRIVELHKKTDLCISNILVHTSCPGSARLWPRLQHWMRLPPCLSFCDRSADSMSWELLVSTTILSLLDFSSLGAWRVWPMHVGHWRKVFRWNVLISQTQRFTLVSVDTKIKFQLPNCRTTSLWVRGLCSGRSLTLYSASMLSILCTTSPLPSSKSLHYSNSSDSFSLAELEW